MTSHQQIGIQEFIDRYIERRYLFALKVERWTFGLIKAKEPVYLWNGGWLHD